jgi:serine/threonine protein phosphatase PrpC
MDPLLWRINMNIDSFLRVGKRHGICQDYIVQTDNAVILADGCSGAENAEIGAIILCQMAKNYLERYKDHLGDLQYESMGATIIHNAEMAARVLKAPRTCLDATLIIAYLYNDMIYVKKYGDGIIIWVTNDDVVAAADVSFDNNRPYYLSYKLNPERNNLYKEENKFKHIAYYDSTGEHGVGKQPVDELTGEVEFEVDDVKALLIASDGISSFNNKPPLIDVVKNLTNFKGVQGSFLKRRMIRALFNYSKDRIWNNDDISIGGFVREEPGD